MKRFYYSTKRVKYMLDNWKIGIHLLFHTKRFGVNNRLWSHYDAFMGNWSHLDRLKAILTVVPLIDTWKQMRFRAGGCHFLADKEYALLYGESKEEYYKRTENKFLKFPQNFV